MIKNIFQTFQGIDAHIFDSASQRHFDENGRLIVDESLITKADVNQYRGSEIVGYEHLGLDPNQIYSVYRPAAELKKCLDKFSGIPLLSKHIMDYASMPQRDSWTGCLNNPTFKDGCIYGALSVWDKDQIGEIESGNKKDLSLGYNCKYKKEDGEFDGKKYSLVMYDITPNHLALVARGRVQGARVFDEDKNKGVNMTGNIKEALKKVLGMLDEDPKALEKEAGKDGCKDAEGLKTELAKLGLDEEKISKILELVNPMIKKEEGKDAEPAEPAEPAAKEGKEGKEPVKPAEKEAEKKKVMDAALAIVRETEKAKEAVMPITGKVAVQDSAADYYKLGLQAMGFKLDGVKDEALQPMFEAAFAMRKNNSMPAPVMDADSIKNAQKGVDDVLAKLPKRAY